MIDLNNWSDMQMLNKALIVLRDSICILEKDRHLDIGDYEVQVEGRADELFGYDHPSADEDKEKIVNIARQILEKVEMP